MRIHVAIYGFAFFLTPGVPHIEEETGDCVFCL